MKEICSKVDESLIEDLVSGQLAGEPYRAALLALDTEPARWRDCALAFLEEQALRLELSELARSTIAWCPDATAAETRGSAKVMDAHVNQRDEFRTALTALRGLGDIGPGYIRPDYARLEQRQRFTSGLLSTAALLLVSFTVGWLGSDILADRKQAAQPAYIQPSLNSVARADVAPFESTTTVSSGHRDSGHRDSGQDYVFGQPSGFMPLDLGMPQPFREMERRGKIHVESHDGLMPATMADGSPVWVPVQEYRLLPATYSY